MNAPTRKVDVVATRRPAQPCDTRRGFSLVEILVAMGIFSVLLALLVPAVASARDSARRIECVNRLRQFGIALHNFESQHGHLPRWIRCPNPADKWQRPSAQVELLPFLDQEPLYQKLRHAKRIQITSPVDNLIKLSIPVFHCPSETVSTGLNYRTCTGTMINHVYDHSFDPRRKGVGVFGGRLRCDGNRSADAIDGLSATVAMSERTLGLGDGYAFQPNRDIWFSGVSRLGFNYRERSVDEVVDVCKLAVNGVQSGFSSWAGHDYFHRDDFTTDYNHVLPPNSMVPDCSLDSYDQSIDPALFAYGQNHGAIGARSLHRDRTVSTLFLDGAVQSVPAEISLAVWRAWGTRQDGD
jgi:prepilin-type N-terminal cleavage/methylation domain-containing protein